MAQPDIRMVRNIEPDFVRGIAILLAMGWHLNGVQTSSWIVEIMLAPGRALGWAGVDLFFVLSGYLIGTLIFREYQKTNNFLAYRFLVRRALKIWPVYYTFLAALAISGIKPWREWLIQNVLHVQNFFGAPIPHLWSLAVEEHFYLLFAISFAFLGKEKNIKKVPFALFSILIIALGLRIYAVSRGVDAHDLQIMSMFRIDSLTAGVFLAYIKAFTPSRFEWLASKKLILFCIAGLGAVTLALSDAHGVFVCTVGYTIAYIAGSAFLLFCYRHPSLLSQRLPVRLMAGIGVFSYGLYIWHVVMIKISDVIIIHFKINDPTGIIILTIRYGGSLMIAILVTRIVEIPFLKLRDRIFPPKVEVKPTDEEKMEEIMEKPLHG